MSQLVYVDLGQCNYQDTLDFQLKLLKRVQESDDDTAYLILVEHSPAVITIEARPESVNFASAGGASTLTGAGMSSLAEAVVTRRPRDGSNTAAISNNLRVFMKTFRLN